MTSNARQFDSLTSRIAFLGNSSSLEPQILVCHATPGPRQDDKSLRLST